MSIIENIEVINNGDGSYMFEVPNGTYCYCVSKEGYVIRKGETVVVDDDTEKNVVLYIEGEKGGSFSKTAFNNSFQK
jgi:hypothetical protein